MHLVFSPGSLRPPLYENNRKLPRIFCCVHVCSVSCRALGQLGEPSASDVLTIRLETLASRFEVIDVRPKTLPGQSEVLSVRCKTIQRRSDMFPSNLGDAPRRTTSRFFESASIRGSETWTCGVCIAGLQIVCFLFLFFCFVVVSPPRCQL